MGGPRQFTPAEFAATVEYLKDKRAAQARSGR